MATPSARVNIDIQAVELLNVGIRAGAIPAKFQISTDLNNGTSDGQIDLMWTKNETGIAASSTTSYDLTGSLKDSFGSNVNFAEVVLIAVRNNHATQAKSILVGPHAVNGFGKLAANKGFWGATADVTNGSGNNVNAGCWTVLYDLAGVPVGAGASDILAVVAAAVAGDTYAWDVLVLGRSA